MKRILILLYSWLAIYASVYAQCAAKNEAIQPGERLTYELKFNWMFFWVTAGEAKMDLIPDAYEGTPC